MVTPVNRRRPFKTGDYVDEANPVHPTRENPQTLKHVTPDISLFKTLTRVARYRTGTDIGVEAAVNEAVKIMPWIKKHYTKYRNEINTASRMDKELRDACCSVAKTLDKYKPPYELTRTLSPQKRREVTVAIRLLASGQSISEGEAETLVRSESL